MNQIFVERAYKSSPESNSSLFKKERVGLLSRNARLVTPPAVAAAGGQPCLVGAVAFGSTFGQRPELL